MKLICLFIATQLLPFFSFSQSSTDPATQLILRNDSLFWNAYNQCDTAGMHEFLSEDAEFYHDKSGTQMSADSILAVSKRNLCSNPDFHLRREAVKESFQVSLLRSADTVYGAVFSGKHLFYVTNTGKPEFLTGQAYFTHLWLLKDGKWKMHRILSYDHGEPPYKNLRKEVKISQKILAQYRGSYKSSQSGTMTVEDHNPLLHLVIGDNTYILHSMSEKVFFTEDRDLEFEFVKNNKGQVTQMIVREHGAQVEQANRVQ